MALAGRSGSSTQADTAIQYLLDPSVQSSGCWGGGNIRDTAIIFYSANPKPAHNGGTDPTLEQCSDYHSQGYSCSTRGDCEELNGTDLPNFNCYGGLICCSKSAVEKTCSEKGGAICSVNEECSGLTDTALGTSSCCLSGQCDPKTQQTNTCEENNYDCKSICSSDEEEDSSYTCSGSEVCCTPSTVTPPAKSYWWLYLLIILIILVVLAILFRNQLKMWWFKMTNKVEKTPIQPQTRPGYPPMMPPRPMQRPPMPMGNMPRRIIPGQPPQQVGPRPIMRPFPKEKELDETLKKLKDMGGNK
jgi:hypothetical protein